MKREPVRHRLALALVLAAALGMARDVRAQISPGTLASAHASLDGSVACFNCHPKGGGGGASMDARCLDCHTEIAAMKSARRGYHATVQKPCATCHPDHGGRDFRMVEWPNGTPERFDHRQAGYALEDAHAKVACDGCHRPELQRDPVAAKIRRKDRARSWLGLSTDCLSCHADPHRDQLGRDCRKCHDLKAWKPAPDFDHDRSRYPLTGAHVKVECAKCHATAAVAPTFDAKGRRVPQWKPLPHQDCVTCHRDPHAGRFPGACAKCHQTSAWSAIRSEGFNHDLTRYPLRGAHTSVRCALCHDEKRAFGAKPKHERCTDCHRDAHAGTATLAGKPADCASCHDVKGYVPSLYTVAAHGTTRYPLEGAHATAKCELCHTRAAAGTPAAAKLGTSRVAMRPAADACQTCHRDPHEGRFTAVNSKAKRLECRSCHTMDRFHPSTYDSEAHEACVFPLEGAHRAVPCAECHGELRDRKERSSLVAAAKGQRTIRFESDARRCVECHDDPHGTQFASTKPGNSCDRCHGADAFQPAARFDHRKHSTFKLDGAHEKVACAACHPRTAGPDGVSRTLYRPIPSRCTDCHADGVPPEPEPRGSIPPRPGADAPAGLVMESAHGHGR